VLQELLLPITFNHKQFNINLNINNNHKLSINQLFNLNNNNLLIDQMLFINHKLNSFNHKNEVNIIIFIDFM
jgi:hypothetical protein